MNLKKKKKKLKRRQPKRVLSSVGNYPGKQQNTAYFAYTDEKTKDDLIEGFTRLAKALRAFSVYFEAVSEIDENRPDLAVKMGAIIERLTVNMISAYKNPDQMKYDLAQLQMFIAIQSAGQSPDLAPTCPICGKTELNIAFEDEESGDFMPVCGPVCAGLLQIKLSVLRKKDPETSLADAVNTFEKK